MWQERGRGIGWKCWGCPSISAGPCSPAALARPLPSGPQPPTLIYWGWGLHTPHFGLPVYQHHRQLEGDSQPEGEGRRTLLGLARHGRGAGGRKPRIVLIYGLRPKSSWRELGREEAAEQCQHTAGQRAASRCHSDPAASGRHRQPRPQNPLLQLGHAGLQAAGCQPCQAGPVISGHPASRAGKARPLGSPRASTPCSSPGLSCPGLAAPVQISALTPTKPASSVYYLA